MSHRSHNSRRYDDDKSKRSERKGDKIREKMEKALESRTATAKAEWAKEKEMAQKSSNCKVKLKLCLHVTCAYTYELTFEEQMERQRQIDQIGEAGFQPAMFVSGQGYQKTHKETSEDAAQKHHDGAMFGPMWKSKEITKKLDQSIKTKPKSSKANDNMDLDVIPLPPQSSEFKMFPLAETWLNLPVDSREEAWRKSFHEQRRQLFEEQI
ncbi:unnamed protein product [Bursaphelenchus okinawaensis]|uniref:Uncharacterized protein n=1 Tax=Bursaphelenchus okinawaensis TaxID=465554 RepID=A0A811LPN6_9BILA|nr:unnamed protein product [Bursaphelenchus okinawaensis]CAG9125610.1 unnamed protein product [Bursaphelenchus okinawaensis]